MKLLNKIKHIFDKKTYEFQIYVNEKETILIQGLKKKQIKNKITYPVSYTHLTLPTNSRV